MFHNYAINFDFISGLQKFDTVLRFHTVHNLYLYAQKLGIVLPAAFVNKPAKTV